MPKRNIKVEELQEKLALMQIEILELRQGIKAARQAERMRIARQILGENEEEE
jgi:hypothetical protein